MRPIEMTINKHEIPDDSEIGALHVVEENSSGYLEYTSKRTAEYLGSGRWAVGGGGATLWHELGGAVRSWRDTPPRSQRPSRAPRCEAHRTDALFIDPLGPYPRLLGFDHCWDEARDARTYAGPGPVVAHPPCNLWVNLAAVNWKRGRQRPAWYPGGDDGGCFTSALADVRRWGGVLEHPAGSHAWAHFGLTRPAERGWNRGVRAGEWTCEVWQSAYGHKARKRTWLLYCGARAPFDLRWNREPGTHQVGWFDRAKPTLGKRAASATPEAFARELVRLAEWSQGRP